jgi:hypothetical protein
VELRPKERKGAMTLTIGTGPFGDQGDKTFNFEVRAPRGQVLIFEDSPRRVRVTFGDETVADSRRVKLMHEQGHLPVYYFPRVLCLVYPTTRASRPPPVRYL